MACKWIEKKPTYDIRGFSQNCIDKCRYSVHRTHRMVKFVSQRVQVICIEIMCRYWLNTVSDWVFITYVYYIINFSCGAPILKKKKINIYLQTKKLEEYREENNSWNKKEKKKEKKWIWISAFFFFIKKFLAIPNFLKIF